jgi:TRAP-type mannitol/chloroaromatic compound transport system permease large subunit
MPYILIVLLAMVLLYVFPEIGLWLPRQVYGS